MTLVATLAGSDQAHRIGIGDLGVTLRADGQPGRGGIIFDDPDSSIFVRGWMKVIVSETACVSQPVLFSGYIQARRTSRNASGKYRHGAARFIDSDIIDENGATHVRLITGADGKREAETHIERNDWLMASAYMSGLVENEDLVDTSNPRPFEEADYRGQYPDDVLNDITGPIARRWFMYLEGDGDRSEFLDVPDATVATSTLSISNVIADVEADDDCYYPFVDAVLEQDPTEVYDKARFTYKNGTVIETNLTTKAEFFDDNDLLYRGIQIDNSRVGLESTARSMAQNILARASKEIETITCRIEVPKEKVGLIRAGQRIAAHFSHLDGFADDFHYTRITGITYRFGETNQTYIVELELNSRGRSIGGGGGAPGPGDFPHPPPTSPGAPEQFKTNNGTVVMDNPVTDGDLLMMWITERAAGNYPALPTGFTDFSPPILITETSIPFGGFFYARLCYRIASGDSGSYALGSSNYLASISEWRGVTFGTEVHQSNQNGNDISVTLTCGGAITPTAPNAIVVGCAVIGMFGGTGVAEDAGVTVISYADWGANPSRNWVGYKVVPSPTSTIIGGTMLGRKEFGGVTYTLLPIAAEEPPSPGQWVYREIVATTAGVGTTAFPYTAGSLVVYVDGVKISSAGYTETDPAAGTFTLAWTPDADETVSVDYQAI